MAIHKSNTILIILSSLLFYNHAFGANNQGITFINNYGIDVLVKFYSADGGCPHEQGVFSYSTYIGYKLNNFPCMVNQTSFTVQVYGLGFQPLIGVTLGQSICLT